MYIHFHTPQWLSNAESNFLGFLGHLKVLWNQWDLRTFVLISLALQTTLILVAPFRKRTANVPIVVLIWLAYLLADYVAYQAVGLIPKHPNEAQKSINSFGNGLNNTVHSDLVAFWSPFLLVHLGGPDTITALALEDNELWLRTALHLGTQGIATGRVFFQSLPINMLWLPTVLMFMAGLLKYLERTSSLFYARLTRFKLSLLTNPDPGPNYAKLMESYDSYKKSSLPANFETNPEPDRSYSLDIETTTSQDQDKEEIPKQRGCPGFISIPLCKSSARERSVRERSNVQLVREAFDFFKKYKGLYVDMIFSFHDRNKSRAYFLQRKAEDAFKVIEVELNFTYEVFFTKMIVIHQASWRCLRYICVLCEVFALLIWVLFVNKRKFHASDVRITYTLLGGAIVLDAIAAVRVVFSDWKIANLSKESVHRAGCYDKWLSVQSRTWGTYWSDKDCPWGARIKRRFFKRWSESIRKFNLLEYCMDPWSRGAEIVFRILPIQDKVEDCLYLPKSWFADDLRDFIFKELKYKSELASDHRDAEEICDSRGDWVLRSLAGFEFDTFELYAWTTEVEYDESLLQWHIATELLYQEEIKLEATRKKDYKKLPDTLVSKLEKDREDDPYRKYCKVLSDYMMYLLNRQTVMMFAVAGISEVRFRDTCAEATKYFDRVLPKADNKKKSMDERHQEACEKIMELNTEISPRDIKGDRSKSVLFDACRLAKKLREIKLEKELKEANARVKVLGEAPQGSNEGETEKILKNEKDRVSELERKIKEMNEEREKKYKEREKMNKEGEKMKKLDLRKIPVGMWELMAKVWLELLGFAAAHCRANAHAAQLKEGAELLTLVWLLMVHLGLGKQFRITQGSARSKLIINK